MTHIPIQLESQTLVKRCAAAAWNTCCSPPLLTIAAVWQGDITASAACHRNGHYLKYKALLSATCSRACTA